MSTYRQLAEMIPAEYRKEILELNIISKAQAIAGNSSMYYLFTIWKNYVETSADLSLDCNMCLSRILHNYAEIQPELIELEKQSKLLSEA